MAYDYGFGNLENELIELFGYLRPDFKKAEELIKAGADINAEGKENDENVLSAIIDKYLFDVHMEMRDDCKDENNLDSIIGPTICEIIRFFLLHGFDVNKCDGCYGAQCLFALVLSTFDRYMIEASKILFNAGAKNRTISNEADEDDTPWSFVGTEGSFQNTCECDYALGNIYEALYQIYRAVDDGLPYNGIDSYECSVGKRILKVLASSDDVSSVFYSIDLPTFKKENCFTSDLYFVYEDGVLRTTQFAEFWVDTTLPECELVDVSEVFQDIVGSVIKSFSFGNRTVCKEITDYNQPIIEIEMDSGRRIKFSINFGDVEDEYRAAYFTLE